MSGYQANAGELMASATTIQGVAGDIEEYKSKVTSSAVTAKDFGREHSAGGSRYLAGLPKIAEAITAHATAVRGLADKLRESANGYDWSDQGNADSFNNTGNK